MATKQQISDAIFEEWTSDPARAGLAMPIAEQMIRALTDAVAAGVLKHTGKGGRSLQPKWYEDLLGDGTAGAEFTLPRSPVAGSVMAFINGVLVEGLVVVDQMVTLPEPKPGAASLRVKYQSWETT